MGLNKTLNNDSDIKFNLSSSQKIEFVDSKKQSQIISIKPKILSSEEIDSRRMKKYKYAF